VFGHKQILLVLIMAACACIAGRQSRATVWQEVRLTDTDSNKSFVSISGTRIVWADNRNHGGTTNDIYCYDLEVGTEFPLFIHPANQIKPQIHADRVVFEDYRDKTSTSDPNVNVYMYDFVSGSVTQITSDPEGQYTPSVYGDRVFWHDARDGGYDIYGYDLTTSTEFPISTVPDVLQLYARAYANTVVWQDGRNGAMDIYGYDLVTAAEFPITTASGTQAQPMISGHILVWEDSRDVVATGYNIYGYDLSTDDELPICTAPGHQFDPDIGDRFAVWHDMRNDSGDIYGLNLSTGEKMALIVASGAQVTPRISGDLVAFLDSRHGHTEIYCAAPLAITSVAYDAQTSELVVSWTSLPGKHYVVQSGNLPGTLTDATGPVPSQGLSTTHRLAVESGAVTAFCRIKLLAD